MTQVANDFNYTNSPSVKTRGSVSPKGATTFIKGQVSPPTGLKENHPPKTKSWEKEYRNIFDECEDTDCGSYGMSEAGHKRLRKLIRSVRTQAIEEGREKVVGEMPKPIEDVFDKRVSKYGCPSREWLYGYNQAIDDVISHLNKK
jgi:hypothetical protein